MLSVFSPAAVLLPQQWVFFFGTNGFSAPTTLTWGRIGVVGNAQNLTATTWLDARPAVSPFVMLNLSIKVGLNPCVIWIARPYCEVELKFYQSNLERSICCDHVLSVFPYNCVVCTVL